VFSSSPNGSISGQIRATEATAIHAALENCGFNRLAAARELGLHKTTLFRKIKRLGIDLPDQDGRSSHPMI